jgi:hypothetical protein
MTRTQGLTAILARVKRAAASAAAAGAAATIPRPAP